MIDEKTTHLKLPLPHADNLLEDDVERLRQALSGVDAKSKEVDGLITALDAALESVRQSVAEAAGKAAWAGVSGKPAAFPPAGHKASHKSGAADALAPADIGAVATTDDRLTDARTPKAHAAAHKHGGADEIATATPAANAIPKAGADGKLDAAWLPGGSVKAISIGLDVPQLIPIGRESQLGGPVASLLRKTTLKQVRISFKANGDVYQEENSHPLREETLEFGLEKNVNPSFNVFSLDDYATLGVDDLATDGKGTWVCVSKTATIVSHDNGTSWEKGHRIEVLNSPSGVATNGEGTWIAIGRYGYMISYDNANSFILKKFVTESAPQLQDIDYGDGVWITVSNQGYMFRSTDNGLTWSKIKASTSLNFFSIKYANGVWLAGTSNSLIYRSMDQGLTWSSISLVVSRTCVIRSIENSGEFWCAIGNGSPGVYFISLDNGFTWTSSKTINSIITEPNKIRYANGIWIVVGTSNYIAIGRKSGNDIAWSEVIELSKNSASWNGIGYGQGVWLIGGYYEMAVAYADTISTAFSLHPVPPTVSGTRLDWTIEAYDEWDNKVAVHKQSTLTEG